MSPSRKETKFVGNKRAIYSGNRSPLCLLFVKHALLFALLCVLSSLSDRSHMQEETGSMPSTQAVLPSPSHNRDGSEKVQKKRTHCHKPFDHQRFVSMLWLCHAQLCDLMHKWALMGSARSRLANARHKIGNGPFFRSNLCRFCSEFAQALPLSFSSPWTMNFFSGMTNSDNKWKLVPNARLPR